MVGPRGGGGSGALRGSRRGRAQALPFAAAPRPPVPGAEVGAEAESCNPAGRGRDVGPGRPRGGAGDAWLGPAAGGEGDGARPPAALSAGSPSRAPPSPAAGEKPLALSGRSVGARRGGQAGRGRPRLVLGPAAEWDKQRGGLRVPFLLITK